MTVVVQYSDEKRIYRIKNLKLVRSNGGLLEMIDHNGIFRGSVNLDKCIIYRVENDD